MYFASTGLPPIQKFRPRICKPLQASLISRRGTQIQAIVLVLQTQEKF